jgi:hypothetical protein
MEKGVQWGLRTQFSGILNAGTGDDSAVSSTASGLSLRVVLGAGAGQGPDMKKKPSRRHHYLPRHYLRGFAGDDGSFFVYDKQNGAIFPTSPDAAFYENDLNTVILPNGSRSDFLEDLYTGVENQSWDSLDNIRRSALSTPIDLMDKMNLFLFLSFLHWRLPGNSEFSGELSQRFFGPDNRLSYFNLKSRTGASVPKEIIEKIKSSPAWKKAAKGIVAFAPFFSGGTWSADLENWRFLYPGDDKNWYIVGDNPIITHGPNDHDPLICLKEFIFPVSGRILLISFSGRIREVLPPAFAIQYGAAIIQRSQRFVACQDKAFLTALVKHYGLYVRFGKAGTIITELFDMLPEPEGHSETTQPMA